MNSVAGAPAARTVETDPAVQSNAAAAGLGAVAGGRIEGVDFLRGVAALAVALFHIYSQNLEPAAREGLPHVVHLLCMWGRWGVQLFFVISGFVIAHTLSDRKDFDRAIDLPIYFARRMVRLDILYYTVLLLYVVAISTISATTGQPADVHPIDWGATALLKNVFYFLPLQATLVMPVAWTLAIEVQFYLFMAAIFIALNRLSRARATIPLFAGITIVSLLWPMGVFTQPIGFWLLPSLFNLLGGTIAYFLVSRPSRLMAACNGIYVVVLAGAFMHSRDSSIAASLAGYVAVVATVTLAPRALVASPIVQALGRWSYGIYLTHQLVGLTIVSALSRAHLGFLSWRLVPLAIGLCATVALSALLHRLVEAPSIRWSKRVARRG